MKRKLLTLALVVLMTAILSGCCLSHQWQDATCTAPKTCAKCQETEGEALGHSWTAATCELAETCATCGETQGAALGHQWQEVTCQQPKTCSVCNQEEGEALPHQFSFAATMAEDSATGAVTLTGTCDVCKQEGVSNSYASWEDAANTVAVGKRDGLVYSNGQQILSFDENMENYVDIREDGTAELALNDQAFDGTWTFVERGSFVNDVTGQDTNQLIYKLDLGENGYIYFWINDTAVNCLAYTIDDITFSYILDTEALEALETQETAE